MHCLVPRTWNFDLKPVLLSNRIRATFQTHLSEKLTGKMWNQRLVLFVTLGQMLSIFHFPLQGFKILCNTGLVSVTRLGDFWKFLGTKFLAKVAQILSNIFGQLLITTLFTLNWCIYFLGNFWRKLGYFTPTSGHSGSGDQYSGTLPKYF